MTYFPKTKFFSSDSFIFAVPMRVLSNFSEQGNVLINVLLFSIKIELSVSLRIISEISNLVPYENLKKSA